MYTFRHITEESTIYGPICHNNATAIDSAVKYINNLVSSGFETEIIPDIKKPFKVHVIKDGSKGFVEVGKIIFIDSNDD